jgi:hypothetical protein
MLSKSSTVSSIRAARVEYSHQGKWVFWADVWDVSPEAAKESGLEMARHLWRKGVAGVRVTLCREEVVLERMR